MLGAIASSIEAVYVCRRVIDDLVSGEWRQDVITGTSPRIMKI